MRRLLALLFVLTFTSAADIGTVFPTASACQLQNVNLNKGFNVKYYPYSLSDTNNYSNTHYLASGYLTRSPLSSASGVSSAQIMITSVPFNGDRTTKLYGMNVIYTHFLFEYTGYFFGKFLILVFFLTNNLLTLNF